MDYSALKRQIISIYRARAKHYNLTANLYYMIGYPEWRYRRQVIAALDVRPGDTVVELGCGTGLNFELLQKQIGPTGRLIGVDLTDAMLVEARQRVTKKGWRNVELVHGDVLDYDYPAEVNGVISSYALSLIPKCDLVIQRAARALAPGSRLALLELRMPDIWPGWLVDMMTAFIRPFVLTEDWLERRPWQTIQRAMRDNLVDVSLGQRYLGTTYIISGGKGRSEPSG
jgi:demethylmenaquinone methyltransferase/2-methoxy-6-polyprenyl-1,4-benzoquinol methylase